MPKIRDRRAQKTSLSVSPWMMKKSSAEGRPPTNPEEAHAKQQLMYSVALSAGPLQQPAARSQQQLQATELPAPRISPAAEQADAQAGSSSSNHWHTVTRRAAAAPSTNQQQQAQQDEEWGRMDTRSSSWGQQGGTAAAAAGHPDCADAAEQQQQQQEDLLIADAGSGSSSSSGDSGSGGSTVLHGVAQLVLLPSGTIMGHFIATPGGLAPQQQQEEQEEQQQQQEEEKDLQQQQKHVQQFKLHLGLRGRQVLGIHSCYRDPEWALLELTLTRQTTGADTDQADHNRNSSGADDDADQDGAAADAQNACTANTGEEAQRVPQRARYEHSSTQQQQQQPAGELSQRPPSSSRAAPPAPAPAAAAAAAAMVSSLPAEVIAWVQRSGGDLVSLAPADLDDEDTEAAVRADNLGLLPDFVKLVFAGHTLLAGPSAAALLAAMGWGQLAGQAGVVVNLGDMSISGLPWGFACCGNIL